MSVSDREAPSRAGAAETGRGRLEAGAAVPVRFAVTIHGAAVALAEAGALVHLQFRRFAGCPVCHLHLRSFVRRRAEIAAAGIREVVFFHSAAADLLPQAGDLPFAVVGDPERRLYRAFGVERSPRAVLDPRVWGTILASVAAALPAVVGGRRPLPKARGDGLGLPADFLVDGDGRIRACKYGVHADDQWSVDDLLALSRR